MICAQRLLRRARATDEEMMEIHLENQMRKNKTKQKQLPLIQATQWIVSGGRLKCRVF